MRVAIYARVSTGEQTTENQIQALVEVLNQRDWILKEVFQDEGISGAKGRKHRPALDDLLKRCVRGEFDVVAAWSVDRLGRSLSDLLNILAELDASGVSLYLHQQALDTTTPAGKAMFQMIGVFAEFERSMIQERVKAGLARARRKGVKLGSKRTVGVKQITGVKFSLFHPDSHQPAPIANGARAQRQPISRKRRVRHATVSTRLVPREWRRLA